MGKSILISTLLLFGLVAINLAQEQNDTKPVPVLSLNTNLDSSILQTLDSGIFIQQFASFLFTGTYNGQAPDNTAADELDIDQLFDIAIQIIVPIIAQDPPDNFLEIYEEISLIKEKLAKNGTTAVKFKEIKKFLNLNTAKFAAYLYWSFNKKNFAERLSTYLTDELLGGLSGKCKQHTALFFDQLPKGKLWAIEMFDSIAKLPPGLLNANINWLGNHKECNKVYTNITNPPMKGKYCRAEIGFPIEQFAGDLPISGDIGLNYGLCISSVCSEDEVASLVSNTLKLMTVFKLSWVSKVRCDEENVPVSTAATVFIVFICILIALLAISTAYDVYERITDHFNKSTIPELETQDIIDIKTSIAGTHVVSQIKKVSEPPKKKRSTLLQFLVNCSVYTNTEKFFRTDNGGKITCLNGIRVFSMIWIIFGHTYNYVSDRSQFFLLDNIRDLQDLNEEAYAQLIINGMYAVDTFFLMSAFLLTISFMNKLEKSGSLKLGEWIYYYVHRYWRLVPPFLIIIAIYNLIVPLMGSGPIFNYKDMPPRKEDCQNYWWAYVLFVNNFIPDGKGTKCMGYLWYIPNDYQFYALSPLFLVILYKFPKAGQLLLSFTTLSSLTILAFLTANVYESRQKNIVEVLFDIWEDVYIKPYCRATPWLVGIALGYIFFKNKKITLNYFVVLFGWLMSTCLALLAIFGGFTNHAKDGRRMETVEYAFFFSLSRFTWSLSIAWIIFACHYGYGGIINTFLSVKTFVPLTRLSYCAYLIHPPIMVFYYYTQETLFHASGFTLVYIAIGHIVMTFVLSYFYTLIFELPFVAIEKLVYPGNAGH